MTEHTTRGSAGRWGPLFGARATDRAHGLTIEDDDVEALVRFAGTDTAVTAHGAHR